MVYSSSSISSSNNNTTNDKLYNSVRSYTRLLYTKPYG